MNKMHLNTAACVTVCVVDVLNIIQLCFVLSRLVNVLSLPPLVSNFCIFVKEALSFSLTVAFTSFVSVLD